MRRRLAP